MYCVLPTHVIASILLSYPRKTYKTFKKPWYLLQKEKNNQMKSEVKLSLRKIDPNQV